jgi:hypothetical protein
MSSPSTYTSIQTCTHKEHSPPSIVNALNLEADSPPPAPLIPLTDELLKKHSMITISPVVREQTQPTDKEEVHPMKLQKLMCKLPLPDTSTIPLCCATSPLKIN